MSLRLILFRAYRYLYYWLYAVDAHSLQSPFVFRVYTQALHYRACPSIFDYQIEDMRKRLKKSYKTIDQSTLGVASSLSKPQTIATIATHGISSLGSSQILCNLLSVFNCKNVLELGTSLGINTLYMSKVSSVRHLVTIEGNTSITSIAQSQFDCTNSRNIELLSGKIDTHLDLLMNKKKVFDFIYIDANHTYEATVTYFNLLLSLSHTDTIMVFDDITWSPSMYQAWQEICASPASHITIENNNIGIVFINPTLEKHNYIINF